MSHYENELIIRAIKMYLEGADQKEVAEELGITVDTLRAWVKKSGHTLRPAKSSSRDWDVIKEKLNAKEK